MNPNQKMALWSGLGLIGTLIIAWYFSRNRTQVASANTATGPDSTPTSVSPMYTFNLAPLNVPGITLPTPLPAPSTGADDNTATVPAPANTCCTRCNGSAQQSAGRILRSGQFSAETFHATASVTALPANQAPINTLSLGSPLGPQLQSQAYGLPAPSYAWWTSDPIYRQAYVQAYNVMVAKINVGILPHSQPRASGIASNGAAWPTMKTMPGSFVDASYDKVFGWVQDQGIIQSASNNSQPVIGDQFQPFSTWPQMSQYLSQALQLYGDPNIGFEKIGTGVTDQTIPTIN